MVLVYCVINRQKVMSKAFSPTLYKSQKLIIKCVNVTNFNVKCESLKTFCEDKYVGRITIFFTTEVSWKIRKPFMYNVIAFPELCKKDICDTRYIKKCEIDRYC